MSKQPSRPAAFDPLSWKLFQSNRNLIDHVQGILKAHSDKMFELRKGIAILADDLEKLRQEFRERKKEGRGRAAPAIGVSARLTLVHYEAEAA